MAGALVRSNVRSLECSSAGLVTLSETENLQNELAQVLEDQPVT
jgi:hypothetical protein